jgi:anti-sigma regulatory factor (Ser/Thr protein kinase)
VSGESDPVMSLRLTAEPAVLMVIRRAVSGVALAAGFSEERIDDIRVAVNEACTNAIVHAYPDSPGPLEVETWSADSRVMVRVRDRGTGIVPDAASNTAGLGLGLQMMAALATDVRVSATAGGGTEVRLRFDRE